MKFIKILLTGLLLLIIGTVSAQTVTGDKLVARKSITLSGNLVDSVTLDSNLLNSSNTHLASVRALTIYIANQIKKNILLADTTTVYYADNTGALRTVFGRHDTLAITALAFGTGLAYVKDSIHGKATISLTGGVGGNLDSILSRGGRVSVNRNSSFGDHTWTMDSVYLKLKSVGTNAVLDINYEGPTPGNGYTILRIEPVIPAESTQTPWLINRTNSAQAGHDGNEVVTMGFNVGPNATALIAGQPAIFWAMESNYIPGTRINEWHQEYN